jgi:hypothetical protein
LKFLFHCRILNHGSVLLKPNPGAVSSYMYVRPLRPASRLTHTPQRLPRLPPQHPVSTSTRLHAAVK